MIPNLLKNMGLTLDFGVEEQQKKQQDENNVEENSQDENNVGENSQDENDVEENSQDENDVRENLQKGENKTSFLQNHLESIVANEWPQIPQMPQTSQMSNMPQMPQMLVVNQMPPMSKDKQSYQQHSLNKEQASTSHQQMPQNIHNLEMQNVELNSNQMYQQTPSHPWQQNPTNHLTRPNIAILDSFHSTNNSMNGINNYVPQQNSQNSTFRGTHFSNGSNKKKFANNNLQEKKCFVFSNLKWVQKLIIIPTKHRGCHDITNTVIITFNHFLKIKLSLKLNIFEMLEK